MKTRRLTNLIMQNSRIVISNRALAKIMTSFGLSNEEKSNKNNRKGIRYECEF